MLPQLDDEVAAGSLDPVGLAPLLPSDAVWENTAEIVRDAVRHWMTRPPSTDRIVPVMKLASSLARKAMARATSSLRP